MQRVQYLSSVGEIGWGSPDLPWAMRLHFSLKQTLGKKKNTIIPQTNTQYKRNTLFPQTKTHLPHKKRSQRQTLLTNKQSQRKKHVSPTIKNSGRKKTHFGDRRYFTQIKNTLLPKTNSERKPHFSYKHSEKKRIIRNKTLTNIEKKLK